MGMSNAGTLHRIPTRPWRWLPWLVASQLAVILVWVLAGWHWALPLMVASHALFMVPIFLPNSRFYAPVLSRVPDAGNSVWLTIDDGPGPETRAVLDLLDRHQARATFFLVGTVHWRSRNWWPRSCAVATISAITVSATRRPASGAWAQRRCGPRSKAASMRCRR